jgi:hypothetical protein
MSDEQDINELLRLLKGDTGFARLRQGVIAEVDTDTCSVLLSESEGTAVPGVRWIMDGYMPFLGDTVWLLKNGADMFVVGRTVGLERGTAIFNETSNTTLPNASRHTHALTEVDGSASVALTSPQVYPLYPGRYRIGVTGVWAGNSAGLRGLYLVKNGGAEEMPMGTVQAGPNTESAVVSGVRSMRFNGDGDHFEVQSNQTSGVGLAGRILEVSVQWVRR